MLSGLFSFLGNIGSLFKTVSPLANFIGNIVGGSKAREQANDDAERNRQFQREERLATQQWQEDMMYKQNTLGRENQEWSFKNFDSPNAQRQAMESAGLNPFVQGSALQPGLSSAMPAASPPSGNPSSGSLPSGKKYEAQMMMAGAVGQAALLQSEIELKKAQAENYLADASEKKGRTLDPELTLQQQRNSIRLQEVGVRKAVADALCAEYDAQIRELKNAGDLAEQEQRLANMREDFRIKQKQQGVLDSEIELAWQKWTTELKQQGLIDEKINTERTIQGVNKSTKRSIDYDVDELKPKTKSKMIAEIDKLRNDVRVQTREDARKALDQIIKHSDGYLDGLLQLDPKISLKGKGSISLGKFDIGGIIHRIFAQFDEERANYITHLIKIAYDIDDIDKYITKE